VLLDPVGRVVGWNAGAQYYSTISFPDLDHDGRADVCGRGIQGVYCAFSKSASFLNGRLWADGLTDAGSWDEVPYYSTMRFADIDDDGRPEVCARGAAGIFCEQ